MSLLECKCTSRRVNLCVLTAGPAEQLAEETVHIQIGNKMLILGREWDKQHCEECVDATDDFKAWLHAFLESRF